MRSRFHLTAVLLTSIAVALTASVAIAETAAPTPSPAAMTTPAAVATPAALLYTGQLLDLQHGFVFFSSGDAYKLASTAVVTDLSNGRPFSGDDVTGFFGRATFAASGEVTALGISRTPLEAMESLDVIHAFAVAATPRTSNPDLSAAEGYTGQPVSVTFTVQVPPATAFTDNVYMSTEASGWDPMAIRMDRVDALHYRITRMLPSGTEFRYRYTRGSWRSEERGQDGLEGAPREYKVHNLDVARRRDTVFHWSDEAVNGIAPVSPDAVPTPFNGRPF